jgi:hypothetical protein
MNLLQSIRRAIRGPIIRFLAGNDLIVVGDIYCNKSIGAPLITISSNQRAGLFGNISAYDGHTAIVPRGCKPPAPTIRAVTDGDWGDARTWVTAGANPAMVYGSKPQAGEGEVGL